MSDISAAKDWLDPQTGENLTAYVQAQDIKNAFDDLQSAWQVDDDEISIETSNLVDGSVTGAKIATAAVTEDKLASNAVTSGKIADGTIVNTDISGSANIAANKIAGTAVTESRVVTAGTGLTGGGALSSNITVGIDNEGVGTEQLADGAVTTGKILDDAVTNAKLADNAAVVVQSTEPSGVPTGTLWVDSDATVDDLVLPLGSEDLADGSVTSAKIADGTITNVDVNASAAIARTKIEGTPPPQARTVGTSGGLQGGGDLSANRTLSIADGGVTNAKLADNAIAYVQPSQPAGDPPIGTLWLDSDSDPQQLTVPLDSTGLADGAVTTPKLADGAVTTAKLADGAVTLAKSTDLAPLGAVAAPRTLIRYTTPGLASVGTRAVLMNYLYASGLWLPTCTVDRIGIEVTSAGGAGTVIRLGIYSGSGVPGGAPLLDAGTIDGTSASRQEITVSQSITAGWYWLVAAAQGGASNPTVRATTGNGGQPWASSSATVSGASAQGRGSPFYSNVSGALPTISLSTPDYIGNPPVIFVRCNA